jgi:hypothetical protein
MIINEIINMMPQNVQTGFWTIQLLMTGYSIWKFVGWARR